MTKWLSFSIAISLALSLTVQAQKSPEDLARRAAHDDMLVKFTAGDFTAAKALAREFLAKYPPKPGEFSQAQDVLDDQPPTENCSAWYPPNEKLPKDWYQLTLDQQRAFYHGLQKSRLPAEFDDWDAARQIDYLVSHLDHVWAQQSGWPGGTDLKEDIHVARLIQIGDPAMPRLIEAIEKDNRLTRATNFWRMGVGGSIRTVREAALVAVIDITRTSEFTDHFTSLVFGDHEAENAPEVARILREYWAKYGALPFQDRPMAILADHDASTKLRQHAALNLVGRAIWMIDFKTENYPLGTHPVIGKYKNPTVAEAIVAALHEDLARHDSRQPAPKDENADASVFNLSDADVLDYQRSELEQHYLNALLALGDVRVVPDLAKLFENDRTWRFRHELAGVMHRFGNSAGLETITQEFESGKLKAFPWRPSGNSFDGSPADDFTALQKRLRGLSGLLKDTPFEARLYRAASALDHPLRHALAGAITVSPQNPVRGLVTSNFDPNGGLSLPSLAVVDFLRTLLDDRTPDSEYAQYSPATHTWQYRHAAAPTLSTHVFGFPDCFPEHHPDAPDKAFKDAMSWFDSVRPALRPATPEELAAVQEVLKGPPSDPFAQLTENVRLPWMPTIAALRQPATKEDVAQGRAAFSLPNSKLAESPALPAFGRIKDELDDVVYLFQAEQDETGQIHLGGIRNHHGPFRLKLQDLEKITPIIK